MITPEEPTTDPNVAIARLVALMAARPGGNVAPRRGRWLIRQAVYGHLWSPERIGEVPEGQRLALRALVSRINSQVFPGGALAHSVTASSVRTMLTSSPTGDVE